MTDSTSVLAAVSSKYDTPMMSFVEIPYLVDVVAMDVITWGKTYDCSAIVMACDLFE